MKFIVKRYEIIFILTPIFLLSGVAVTSNQSILNLSHFKVQSRENGKEDGHHKLIALTFDDGPHPHYTKKLIEILKKHDVTATFFLVGKQIEKHPELLKEIVAAGFEVGGHTYSHRNLKKMSRSEIMWELEKTRLLIREHTSMKVFIFRPPGGQIDEDIKKSVGKFGYKTVMWDVFPKDHEHLTSEEVLNRVLKGSASGGIVLLHSGKSATIDALEKIIPQMKSRGFAFVTATEYERAKLKFCVRGHADGKNSFN